MSHGYRKLSPVGKSLESLNLAGLCVEKHGMVKEKWLVHGCHMAECAIQCAAHSSLEDHIVANPEDRLNLPVRVLDRMLP